MHETRDLGIQWPQWHTLLFEGHVAVDMGVVYPQDVKKMLLKQARMICWRRWAAKHKCEELKKRSVAGAKPSHVVRKDQGNRGQTCIEM